MKYKIPFMTLLSFNIIAISAFGWFFINGTKQRGVDERTSIILSTDEKDYILYEMRGLLEAIGEIVTALSEGEFAKVSSAARLVGSEHMGGEPISLVAKLPIEFKKLGMETHELFALLAVEAEDMRDQDVILDQLGNIINNCTTCHSAYQLVTD